ncbi:MAG: hypothetical protein M1826_006265 [Phylliscum demangeonii]|nr:MAG: hypothetical protein M1826_006265 [Phylliscum demangeonii]
MLNPALFLVGCLLVTGGAMAFPQPAPAPPAPPSQPNKDRHLEQLFPADHLSQMGRADPEVERSVSINPKMFESVRHDPEQLAAYHAYRYAVSTQTQLILYIMKRDQGFETCVEREMIAVSSYADLALWFYAAEICQRSDGRDFGIFFPRAEHYLAKWVEDVRYSQANIDARVEAKAKEKSSNAFHLLPALSPPHGLSRMMSRLSSTARHWEMGVKKVPWAKVETQFKTEPKPLLLEGRY